MLVKIMRIVKIFFNICLTISYINVIFFIVLILSLSNDQRMKSDESWRDAIRFSITRHIPFATLASSLHSGASNRKTRDSSTLMWRILACGRASFSYRRRRLIIEDARGAVVFTRTYSFRSAFCCHRTFRLLLSHRNDISRELLFELVDPDLVILIDHRFP